MTRIAGVPEQLEAAAALLVASGPELELVAQRLASAPLPEMPPGVAGAVAGTMMASSAGLRRAAAVARREGEDLRRRGLWLRFADAAAAVWHLSIPARAAADIPLQIFDFAVRRRARELMKVWQYEREATQARSIGNAEAAAQILLVGDLPGGGQFMVLGERAVFLRNVEPAVADSRGFSDAMRIAAGRFFIVSEFSGKVMGPIGVIGGFQEVVVPEHHGWKGYVDRAAGASGALGSALSAGLSIESLGAAGTIALIPGIDVIIPVLIISAAGWELYTHKKEVLKVVVAGGKALAAHRTLVLIAADPPLGAASALWDHRKTASG